MTAAPGVEAMYRDLLRAWNDGDARAFGAAFADGGSLIGFDGSPVESGAAIVEHLEAIFADHRPAAYVATVREVRELAPGVALLRAAVGMLPPGSNRVNPDVNALQAMVAVGTADGWRIAHLQTTPAAFHGRPEAVDALTAELQDVADASAGE